MLVVQEQVAKKKKKKKGDCIIIKDKTNIVYKEALRN